MKHILLHVAYVFLLGIPGLSYAQEVFINEIHYDNDGTDSDEAIEIAGPASTDLTGWQIVLYNGSGGAVYGTTDISVVIPDQQNGYGTTSISYPSNGIQNGSPDGIALVNAEGGVVQFISYEGQMVAVGGPADGMTSTDIGVAEGGTTAIGFSLQLTGTGYQYSDFTWQDPTAASFGNINANQTFGEGGGPTLPSVTISVSEETIVEEGTTSTTIAVSRTGSTDASLAISYTVGGSASESDYTPSLSGTITIAAGQTVASKEILAVDDTEEEPTEEVIITLENSDQYQINGSADVTISILDNDTPVTPSTVLINEIDSDTPGTDVAEFIELYDGGAGNTSLDGLVVVLFNGSNNLSYSTIDLNGYSTDDAGYFVIGSAEVANVDLEAYTSNGLQNGADAVALYQASAADFPNGTSIIISGLLDAIVYDTDDSDDEELLVLLNEGQPQVNENGAGDKVMHSLQRVPNGEGGARNTDTYQPLIPTPGTENGVIPISLFLNEVRISSSGSSDNVSNYVEIFGEPGITLDDVSLVVLSGEYEPGAIDFVFDLSGITIDEDSIVLVANEDIATVIPQAIVQENDLITSFDFYGSPSAFFLVKNFTGTQGDDLDTDNDGTLDQTPWSEIYHSLGFVDGDTNQDYVYTDNVTPADGSFTAAGAASIGNGTSDFTALAFADYSDDTPGFSNVPDTGNPGEPGSLVFIHEIQGTTDVSPLSGQTVSIRAIVTGDFQPDDNDLFEKNLGGFYLQEEVSDYDEDELTSEGIFVYQNGSSITIPDVTVGDTVEVTGTVDEYNGLTEMTNLSAITVISGTELPSPVAVELPATAEYLERYEGMLVNFKQSLVISEYFNFDKYNEIVLALPLEDLDRHYNATSYLNPGEAAASASDSMDIRTLLLDDARSTTFPAKLYHPNGEEFTTENRFRGGDLVENTTGILSYSFSTFRVQPTKGADYTSVNPRTPAPHEVGGQLKVASFNVLNYFTTLDDRGAATEEEFIRQRTKIIAAIQAINADIVGLIEIENNTEAIEDLVSGLNEAMGEGTYDYLNTGVIGTDAIKVAFIYKPATVSLQGDYALLDQSVDARFDDGRNRPALAQTFQELATQATFTISVNHLKSKGSGCGSGDDDAQQGNCNFTRTQAAEALVDWLQGDPTGSGDPDFMVIGDLNSYDKEDPIAALLEGADDESGTADDLVDLAYAFQGEFAYSYVFDGRFGYLDYAIASQSLVEQVTGATDWHINSDEPDVFDYTTGDYSGNRPAEQLALYQPNPYRASDHDPVVIGLALVPEEVPVGFGECELFLKDFEEAEEIVAAEEITFASHYSHQDTYVIGIATGTRTDGLAGIWEIHNDCSIHPVKRTRFKEYETTILPEILGLERKWGWQYEPFGISEDGQFILANAINEDGYQDDKITIEPGEVVSIKFKIGHPVLGRIMSVIGFADCKTEKRGTKGGLVILGCKDGENARIADLKDNNTFGSDELEIPFTSINTYPNPVVDHLSIGIESPVQEKATVVIRDLTGRQVYQKTYRLENGYNQLELETKNWNGTGEFIISVTIPGQGVFHQKVLK